jgi:uncharacterized protein YegJ (DUF2314 family)
LENANTVIKDGDFIKKAFVEVIDGEEYTENMWVKVTKCLKNDVYECQLWNDPFVIKSIKYQDSVIVKRSEIMENM